MAKAHTTKSDAKPKLSPALSPEAEEDQLVALATRLAKKQLLEGTASSQTINYYLKLGSSRERLEQEKLKLETELLQAKTEAAKSLEKSEELYKAAIDAFKTYSGYTGEDENRHE